MNYQQQFQQLINAIQTEPMMNDDRKQKLILLLQIAQDVVLEEECVRAFFKDIRGGEAT